MGEKIDQISFTEDERKKFLTQMGEQKCKGQVYCMRYTEFRWNLERGDLR